jgi:hypothetical protein
LISQLEDEHVLFNKNNFEKQFLQLKIRKSDIILKILGKFKLKKPKGFSNNLENILQI